VISTKINPKSILQNQGLLQRLILGLLVGSFVILLAEIRYEHRIVLSEKWQAWIPVIYLSLSCVLGPFALIFFRRWGKAAFIFCFVSAITVGVAGFFLHAKGQPIQRVQHVITEDFKEPGHLQPEAEEFPPILAPLAITGLGLIGVLVSLGEPAIGNQVDRHDEQSDDSQKDRQA
jgi:hypothetical protein